MMPLNSRLNPAWQKNQSVSCSPPIAEADVTLSMRRIVLFTKDMPGMVAFYRDVLGLKLRTAEKGWKEFDANGCIIALHNGTSEVGRRPPKIGFWAKDIAATRQGLIGRGAKMSKLMVGGGLVRCEGKDPDGNPFYVSDRA
jgi:catechol 2,3-dioxygenase-like lactoylglutathione lyase family enzyme